MDRDSAEILERIRKDNMDYHEAMYQLVKQQQKQIAMLTEQVARMQQMMAQAMGLNQNQNKNAMTSPFDAPVRNYSEAENVATNSVTEETAKLFR